MIGKKTKICTICKARGYTEWHHIISQHHARVSGQEELIDNPDNVIELCKRCHDQTTASMVRKRLQREGKFSSKKIPKPKKLKRRNENIATKTRGEIREAREERKNTSISSLASRGVLHDGAPPMGLLDFLEKTRFEDEINDKWFKIISDHDVTFPNFLRPTDHWLHDEESYDKDRSLEFEQDGFVWCSNGQSWKSGLSSRRAKFEIDIANIRREERTALEELQRVAVQEEEKRKKIEQKEESWRKLQSRGVLYLVQPNPPLNLLQGSRRLPSFVEYLKKLSVYDDLAMKWTKRLSTEHGVHSLNHLYPKDHWLHDQEEFVKKHSSEFEEDGFCWTKDGGIWKNNLTLRQIESELRLADIRERAEALVLNEERQLEKERVSQEAEQKKQESLSSLRERGVIIGTLPRGINSTTLSKYLHGISTESEKAERWSQYFREIGGSNPLLRLYPKDHWMHSPEDFHEELSIAFEEDGFSWTEKGLAWIDGLSIEQVDAEIRLALVKKKQKETLEREREILEKIKSKKKEDTV